MKFGIDLIRYCELEGLMEFTVLGVGHDPRIFRHELALDSRTERARRSPRSEKGKSSSSKINCAVLAI